MPAELLPLAAVRTPTKKLNPSLYLKAGTSCCLFISVAEQKPSCLSWWLAKLVRTSPTSCVSMRTKKGAPTPTGVCSWGWGLLRKARAQQALQVGQEHYHQGRLNLLPIGYAKFVVSIFYHHASRHCSRACSSHYRTHRQPWRNPPIIQKHLKSWWGAMHVPYLKGRAAA